MIAVAGATGSVGGALVAQLASSGEPVRALTRRPAAWTGPAVEVAGLGEGPDDAPRAFAGARAAFLMSSERITPGGAPERLAGLVEAAVGAGVEQLVVLSVFSGAEGDDVVGRWNAASEALVTGCGVPWTLLRPGRFLANARHWARFVRTGEPVPVGLARRAAAGIDPADVAAVAAAALADPAAFAGRGPRLTGPESLTPLDELRVLGEVLGRDIPARELGPDDVRRGMLAGGQAPEVVDAMLARALGEERAGEGAEPLPAVADLLGRPPRRFAEWARAHAAEFGG